MVPLLVVLLVVGLAVAGAAGIVAFGSDPAGTRGLAGASPAAGLAAAVAGVLGIVAVGTVAVVVLGGRQDPPSEQGSVVDRHDSVPAPDASHQRPELGPEVRLVDVQGSSEQRSFPASTEVVDGLARSTVLQVRVEGFPAFADGVAEQCLTGPAVRCGNRIPVQFDGQGRARFQYLVVGSFAPAAGGCGADVPPCQVVVRARGGPYRAVVQTVFGDTMPPPGVLRVSPHDGLADGQRVQVELRDLPAGAQVWVTTCAAPATRGPARCGAPAPAITLEIGPDGSAAAELTVVRGPVGSGRVGCGGDQACGVVVTSDVTAVRAPVVPISFAAPPGADYDPPRLVSGLTVAALLAGLAGWMIRRTDWSAVGEAAAPELDDAEYADLDAIVAAMPPDDEADLLTDRRP